MLGNPARLAAALGQPVEVRFGHSRSSPVRATRRGRGPWVVHLHEMFAEAPPEVEAALVAWLRSGRRAGRACLELDEWIEARLERLYREEPLPMEISTAGRHHDLASLSLGLLEREFRGDFANPPGPPRITWGRGGGRRARRSMRLGSYDHRARVVRVHRALDRAYVPGWFVRYVLFHELLHAALDLPAPGRRRVLHGPEFKRRERGYPDYERALSFERRNIEALLRTEPGFFFQPFAPREPRALQSARSAKGWKKKPGSVRGP